MTYAKAVENKPKAIVIQITVCTTSATQIFPDNGVSLNFNYYDNTHNLIAKIQVAPRDCQ
jgi:hypothetical protein